MHMHFIHMVLKVSFARKLLSTLVAFARNCKISVPKIEYQHVRALSYGLQGFISICMYFPGSANLSRKLLVLKLLKDDTAIFEVKKGYGGKINIINLL